MTGLLGSKERRVAQTGRSPITKELTPYSQEPIDGTHLHKGHNIKQWIPTMIITPEKYVSDKLQNSHSYFRRILQLSDFPQGYNERFFGLFSQQVFIEHLLEILRWLSGKEYACQCRRLRRYGIDPWVGKIPWRRAWQPTPVHLLEKSHGHGAWQAMVHGVAKS